MISKADHEIFKRFNTVALARVAENKFQIPDNPPFWLLPFLEEGEESERYVSFDDPLSFVSNFLIDAEDKWRLKTFGSISSGIYSIQKGESPELFYECRADLLDGMPVLFVELIGEGTPGSSYESVRSARSERLSKGVGLSQNRKYLGSAANTHLNGLPVMEGTIEDIDSHRLSTITYNAEFKRLYFKSNPDIRSKTIFYDAFGREISKEIWDLIEKTTQKNSPDSTSFTKSGADNRQLQLNAIPHENGVVSICIKDTTDRLSADQWLPSLTNRSSVTGLLSSNVLTERLEQAINLVKETGQSLGIIYININGFSNINHTFGRLAADGLLSALAERLVESVSPVHSVFHLDGDEFAIILENVKNSQSLVQIETSIRHAINEPYQLHFLTQNILVRAGLSIYGKDATQPEALLNSARAKVNTRS